MTNFNAPSSALLSTYDSARRIFLYVRRIEARSAALLRDLELDLLNGGHNHVNLRREAHQMRNDVLNEMRKWSTPLGKAFSRALKEEGLTYGRILEKYLLQLYPPNINNATALTGIIRPKERFRAAGRGIVDGARWRVTNGLAPDPFNPLPPHLGLAMATSPEVIHYRFELLRQAATNLGGRLLNPALSREVIRASGRSNSTVNFISWGNLLLSGAVIATGCVLTVIAISDGSLLGNNVRRHLTISDGPTGITGGTTIVSQLVAGQVVNMAGGVHCINSCVTGCKIGFVFFVYIGLTALLMGILEYFLPSL